MSCYTINYENGAKNHLLQMNYSCIPGEDMLLKGCKTPSDCVGMDVDFDPNDPDYEQKMNGVPAVVLSNVVNYPVIPEVITELSTDNTDVINNNAELSTTLDYNGIPYQDIIEKWWELYNGGQTPIKSNRDVLTFELAVNLRHICGFDRMLLNQLIPCYDGFSEAQKMKCIDSALAEKRTQMPKRMKEVLEAVRRDLLTSNTANDNTNIINALDAATAQDELFHYDRLPKLPQGVSDSIDAAGHSLAMPTLIAIAPAIGALATGVKLDVHGKAKGLNLCSFIVGEFASGKGQMDDIIGAWMTELQAQADIYNQQEEEWAMKAKRMKSGKAPE